MDRTRAPEHEMPSALGAAVRIGAPRWLRGLGAIVAMFAPFAALVLVVSPIQGILPALFLGSILVAAFRDRRHKDAVVAVDTTGLRLDLGPHRRCIRRDDIASSFDDAGDGRATLELKNGTRIELTIPNAEARTRILAHLGQTLDQQALVAPLRGQLGAFTRGLLAFCGSLFALPFVLAVVVGMFGRAARPLVEWFPLATLLISIALTVLVVKRLGYPRVVVGAEGIRLAGRLFPRMIPYPRIRDVEPTPLAKDGSHGIRVRLDDGKELILPTIAQSPGQTQALIRRIWEGRRRYNEGGRSPLENLERAGRTIKAWREDLSRTARGGGFRQASIDPRDLESLVLDPAAPIDRRVGAALALREVDPGAPVRVRIAAARAVDDRIRTALEESAADELDEERLDRALS